MDGAVRGAEAEEVLVHCGPVGAGEVGGVAVEGDDEVGLGVGEEELKG